MGEEHENEEEIHDVIPISGMYENWFLDYASYVILERAVPAINDGLKPVQRRILHAMKEMDDGRYNKVANIIGSAMQYHPHGDASIGDAIVNLGQKDLLIDTQGNWGDVRTGDSAAAPRYIEARLSKFALEVLFNPQTTEWQLSYDGRKKEPVTFPVKFPLLLAQGVEGIAVGLSTKMLPHNFCEILEGCIATLKGKKVKLLPDFQTGGKIDVTDYNDGKRGGKVRVRATIEERDSKTLVIKDIPYGTTTTSLIESIVKANDKGKIKVKQVIDNTAKDIEILVNLAPGTSPDITMDALYAFTDCEVSISPNACVIINDKPHFIGISEILKQSVDQTVDLLRQELEIEKAELKEKIFFSDLLKIFINEGMYKNPEYENSGDLQKCYEVLNTLFTPFFDQFYREITNEDYKKLIDKPLSSITRFDTSKVEAQIRELQEKIEKVDYSLDNLTEFAIEYYQNLLDKYGKGRERKTEITNFDTINVTVVAANNAKLYVNRKDGFIGYGLKKDEFVCDCSDIDDIISFTKDGKCVVTKIQDKVFVGKDILYTGVFKKNDERMVYNMAYVDSKSGNTYVKRFQVLSVTRDREYDLTKKNKGSKVHYFTANPNGEAEIVTVSLTQASKARKKVFDFDFAELEIKGRGAGGNILTKYPVRKIVLKEEGRSTLGGVDIWYDPTVGRLNREERGELLGNFMSEDQIVAFYKDGTYETTSFELTNHYDFNSLMGIYKLDQDASFNAIHYDGESKNYYVKRFIIETNTPNKKFSFVTEARSSKLVFISKGIDTDVEVTYKDGRKHEKKKLDLMNLIDIKGWRAIGNKLPVQNVISVSLIKEEKPKENSIDLDEIKNTIKSEVEEEENQLGLFGEKKE
ncbi:MULTISPECIES: DNA gyrase/topoisomerase IV subunit A [unclassified Ekhidna]|jgi:topoisomerase-4 subunit A|uniref:DNA gyrase/topoisomerase IV subunit A n=1 Tax=unclassified Ekhidna TaxID=2632188 RepID=UPI0032DF2858